MKQEIIKSELEVNDNKIKVINPAPAVAKQTKILLHRERKSNNNKESCRRDSDEGKNTVSTTGSNIDILKGMALKIVGDELAAGEITEQNALTFQNAIFKHIDIWMNDKSNGNVTFIYIFTF